MDDNVYREFEVIALIPARARSKGIPEKNLVELGGKSLVERAIYCAKNSPFVDHVVVSTDSSKIIDQAVRFGAIPHARELGASTDDADANTVVIEFLKHQVICEGKDFILAYLQPTSPFRTSRHLNDLFELMNKEDFFHCTSVTENLSSPFKAIVLDQGLEIKSIFDSKHLTANRQTLQPTFRPNGAIYTFLASQFKCSNAFPIVGSLAFVMDQVTSIDIDSEQDLLYARFISDELGL
jgi:CMP-N-acetylneuraminic acid synthetase